MKILEGLTVICGGIGTGKSVVSKILALMDYPVYDCDSRARDIMDCDETIHSRLCSDIHPLAVTDGKIDRRLISEIVFADSEALKRLNGIVHHAVTDDLVRWYGEMRSRGFHRVFVETAIPRQSGLAEIVDEIWEVEAPIQVRVGRVMVRSGLTEDQVLARIRAQESENLNEIPHYIIRNSEDEAVLPQIHALLRH